MRLELFRVWSRDLPDYYTVLGLPEGRYLTFQGPDGDYRHVLEEATFHGPDLLSYRIPSLPRRRYAHRLEESENPRRRLSARLPRAAERPDPEQGRAPGGVVIRPELGPPISELWQQAERLREAEHFHSLRGVLNRILGQDPDHRQALRWRRRVEGWIEQQKTTLTRQLSRHLGELATALEGRELARALQLWSPPDRGATRGSLAERISAYPRLRVWARLRVMEVHDGVAECEAVVTLEGRAGGRRQTTIEEVPWRARFARGVFLEPFPPG